MDNFQFGNSWAYHGTRFMLKGYCVFQLNYGHVPQLPGIGGMDLIENSAQQLKTFVDQVLNATGTSKVKSKIQSFEDTLRDHCLHFIKSLMSIPLRLTC